ncbi:hypothetical protein KBP30_16130 [Streptomyces sp. Go40/10]|uniref:hypothetical protein n=1 Tax=Streptomyces sp. Go40/10 TaxID=2825844 RepID=UPI001E553331|nr:hypothetical protein [Streptomyces sp. Go40/10]UFR02615.1 hypothetical protein KBP30_16130 [Streptomyces sp. Go40/10]
MPPRLRGVLGAIGAYESTYDGFLDVLGGSPDRLAALVRRAERRVDVADFGVDELRDALRAEAEDVGQDVWLAWPGERTAARAAYRTVLARLDDLWCRGQDDLVIIDGGERVIVLDHEGRLLVTRADARLRIHSVADRGATAVTCVVRCVGGVVRVGQRFGVGPGAGTGDDAPLVALEGILRYGRPVDFVDPPHSAQVRLTGDAVAMVAPGHVITAVVGR